MLTADLVRVRRRANQLVLQRIDAKARQRARLLAQSYIDAASASVGESRADFDERCAAVSCEARDHKLAAGLRKLVTDRCTFEQDPAVDPVVLRESLFTAASCAHQELADDETFDRAKVVAFVAEALGLGEKQVEDNLYGDLRRAHRLLEFSPIGAEQLVSDYELAQAQAVLLRATQVQIAVARTAPEAYRRLFYKLKFLRLLYTLQETDDGFLIVVDGPHSLFQATTKYGLQLALLLPAIRDCGQWTLCASVRWPKAHGLLEFSIENACTTDAGESLTEPEVFLSAAAEQLVSKFAQRERDWCAAPADTILNLPGVGLCVPDLTFTHRVTQKQVHVELLGYWSRKAVWQRVRLVEQGLTEPILFVVSERLRVSEAALPKKSSAALLVYKGVVSASAVEKKLDALDRASLNQ